MSRMLLFLIALALGPAVQAATTLPEFPKRGHLVTKKDVKEYWISQLTPRFGTPSRLRKNYATLRARYYDMVRERKRVIEMIEAGMYDDRAELEALRNNLGLHEFRRRHLSAEKLRKEIAALEFALAQQRLHRPPPDPLPGQPAPAPDAPAPQDPEVIYVEVDADEDCPPMESHHGGHNHHRPGHRPGPRLETETFRPTPPTGNPARSTPIVPSPPTPSPSHSHSSQPAPSQPSAPSAPAQEQRPTPSMGRR